MFSAHIPRSAIAMGGTARIERARRLAPVVARLAGPRIDRKLAEGTVPWSHPSYAARAIQLTSRRRRIALARSLEILLEQADEPARSLLDPAVPVCRTQVRHALPAILVTAARLRSDGPVDARGVAQLRRLLRDGNGPCYTRVHPEALTLALQRAYRSLDVVD